MSLQLLVIRDPRIIFRFWVDDWYFKIFKMECET